MSSSSRCGEHSAEGLQMMWPMNDSWFTKGTKPMPRIPGDFGTIVGLKSCKLRAFFVFTLPFGVFFLMVSVAFLATLDPSLEESYSKSITNICTWLKLMGQKQPVSLLDLYWNRRFFRGCFFLKPRIGRIAKRRWSSIRCMSWFDPLWHSSQSWVFNWNMRPCSDAMRFQGDLWVPRCSQSYLMFFLLNNPRETYHSEGVIIVYSCNGNLETHSVFLSLA